ncbi:MAG: four helix bundle protein [Chitinophagales bacterium]|jgi:four helix bundle protein|nr:four helix bundle protein [Sphingobacteriales bacterium]
MENKNALLDKSKSLALLIIKHCRNISEVKKEYILTRQLMKSGTSIGANIREAKYAESKNDFIHKYKISLKEANETEYWIELLFESELMNEEVFNELHKLNTELLKILTSSIKTLSNR